MLTATNRGGLYLQGGGRMKPYRGTLLACAVLLVSLPLVSCGDADRWDKTTQISLTGQAGTGLGDIILTVKAAAPAVGYECDEVLEYRAEGAGVNIVWRAVPGTGTTRIFRITPLDEGIMSVIARGKCYGSLEDWKYSNQVDITVTEQTPPTVTAMTLTATPATITLAGGPPPTSTEKITVALTATGAKGCSLNLMYQYYGGGYSLTTVDPASQGVFELPLPPGGYVPGTITVMATGWCSQNPSELKTATATVTVN